jgi:DNA-binding HxlR family transcriptional regulator
MPRHDAATICPMDGMLRTLMGPWTTYIVWLLHTHSALRFGALKALIPTISSKMLTERLRHLEASRLVHRDYRPTIPPTVTYSLTPRGQELSETLGVLAEVALRWQQQDNAAAEPRLAIATASRPTRPMPVPAA